MVTNLRKMKAKGNTQKFIFGILLLLVGLTFLIANASATVDNVNLISPNNGDSTTKQTLDFEFENEGTLDGVNCTLYIDNINIAVINDLDDDDNEIFEDIDLGLGDYNWNVSCTDNESTKWSNTYNIEIIDAPEYCEDGDNGDFNLEIDDIDSGDEFIVGENIEFTVNVENNGDDDYSVYVEAVLYDLTNDEEISSFKLKKSIDEDDDVDYDVSLEVPYDIDEGNEFIIQVKAYKSGDEDENCNEEAIEVEFDRESNLLVFDKLYLSSSEASCSSYFDVTAKIANAGDDDEEDAKIKVYSTKLGISGEKTFDIDSGDRETYYFTFLVPETAEEGNYTIYATVYYNDLDESKTELLTLTVAGNCKEIDNRTNTTQDIIFNSAQLTSAFTGSSFMIKVDISNPTNTQMEYLVMAKDYSTWASLSGITPSVIVLDAGESSSVYITLVPLTNASESNILDISVSSNGITKEQTLTIPIQKSTQQASIWDQLIFEFKRQWWLVTLNVLLFIGIILLLIALLKPRKRFPNTEIRLRSARNGNGNSKKRK
jgi:hypothetical protein